MSVTNTWVIEQMDCYPAYESQIDVVFIVHWRVNATNGVYSATNYGTTNVVYVAGEPYTPYANLTQTQVINWVQSALGAKQVASIETELATNIANQTNPPVISLALPWGT
jgi:hypothetical protein